MIQSRIDNPSVRVDQHGIVQWVSADFAESYGWTPASLIGLPLTEVIPPEYHPAHQTGFSRFLATQVPHLLNERLRLPVLAADGTAAPSEVCIAAERDADGWTFLASVNRIG